MIPFVSSQSQENSSWSDRSSPGFAATKSKRMTALDSHGGVGRTVRHGGGGGPQQGLLALARILRSAA